MTKIAVVIPVFRAGKFLIRCLKSILNQTYKEFSVILVDDGSDDLSGEICDSFCNTFDKVVSIHAKNGGASAARNTAIDYCFLAGFEYVSFIDSDDWVHPEYLNVLYSNSIKYKHNGVSAVNYKSTQGEEIDCKIDAIPKVLPVEEFYCNYDICASVVWGKLLRTEDFRTVRFPLNRITEDEYVTWKLLFKYDNVVFVESPLYAYYLNDKSVMHTRNTNNLCDMLDGLEERLIWFSKNPKYSKAHSNLHKKYLWHILDAIKQLKQIPERKKELSEVNRKLRRFLKTEKMSINEYDDLYKIAYPNTFRIKFAFFKVKNMF